MFSLSLTWDIDDWCGLTCWRQAFVWRQHWAPHVDPGAQTPLPGSQIGQHFIHNYMGPSETHRGVNLIYSLTTSYPYISWVDLFTEVRGELALFEGEEVDGSEEDHDDSTHASVDSEDDFRPWNPQRSESASVSMVQLTMGLYEHSAKDGTTEAAKTMVNTLKNPLGRRPQFSVSVVRDEGAAGRPYCCVCDSWRILLHNYCRARWKNLYYCVCDSWTVQVRRCQNWQFFVDGLTFETKRPLGWYKWKGDAYISLIEKYSNGMEIRHTLKEFKRQDKPGPGDERDVEEADEVAQQARDQHLQPKLYISPDFLGRTLTCPYLVMNLKL